MLGDLSAGTSVQNSRKQLSIIEADNGFIISSPFTGNNQPISNVAKDIEGVKDFIQSYFHEETGN